MQLWHKVTIGLILGIAFGVIVRNQAIWFPDFVPVISGVFKYTKPVGDIFIDLIKMIIAPLIFFALIAGITSVSDTKAVGRMGTKAVFAYMSTTAFAILIGIVMSWILKPGIGVNLELSDPNTTTSLIQHAPTSFMDILMGIIPNNALKALVDANIVQIVFVAIFVGVAMNALGESARKLVELCQIIAQVIFKIIGYIIQLAPYASFALMAWVVGTQGYDVLIGLLKLIGAVALAMLLQYLVFGVFIKLFAGLSPLPFYRKSLEYQLVGISTSSSKATLATTMSVCKNKLGISPTSTSFVLPLGATINLDGTAIYLSMCALFFAQALNITLTPYDYIMIMFTATFGSMGAGGVPGGALIVLPMVLSAAHIPMEAVELIVGIDRIVNMMRTTINITGDAAVTLIVDKSEGHLNVDVYNS